MSLRNDSRAETRMGKRPSDLTPIAAGIVILVQVAQPECFTGLEVMIT